MDNQVIFAIITATGWALAYMGIRKAWHYRALAADISKSAEKTERNHANAQRKQRRLESDHEHMAESLAESNAALAKVTAECEKQTKLAQERFEMLDGLVQEKQIVWRMYRDSTRQAGTAQNWLMREYAVALQLLNAYRKKAGESEIRVPEQLRALVAEFGETAKGIPDVQPPPEAVPAKTSGSVSG